MPSTHGRLWSRGAFALQVVVALALVYVIAISVQHAFGRDGRLDLDSFLHAGASYREGLNPYAINHPEVRPPPLEDSPNLNPPVSVYAFALLTPVDAGVLRYAFAATSLALFAGLVALLTWRFPEQRQPLVLLAVAAMAGLWYVVEYNQIYLPLVASMTGAWLLLRRDQNLLAGLLIGLVMAIKPQFGTVAIVLFASGYRAPALSSLVTAALISLVPLALDGPSIYQQWLAALGDFGGYMWPGNASLVAVGGRLGAEALGYAFVALMLAGMLLWTHRVRPAATVACSAGIIAVILTGPTSWPGYTLFLLPVLFSRRWDWRTWTAMALFAVPQWTLVELSGSGGPVSQAIANLNVYAVLLMLWTVVSPPAEERAAEEDVPFTEQSRPVELRPALPLRKAG